MPIAAIVLYEDRRGPAPRDFGPHRLLLACVADEGGVDRWDLRGAIRANVRNSDSKVLRSIREQSEALSAGGTSLVAFLDADHVRELVGLPGSACKREVLATITVQCPAADSLAVVLLERNLEDLLAAARRALKLPETEAGSKKPTPNARDVLLNRAAAADRRVRDEIRAAMPSFDRLVRVAVEAWRQRTQRRHLAD